MMTLKTLKEIIKINNDFSKYIDKISDLKIELVDTPIFECFYALFDKMIQSTFNEVQTDYIFWWLYEDVDKIIYDDTKEIDVTEIEDLYEYLKTLE